MLTPFSLKGSGSGNKQTNQHEFEINKSNFGITFFYQTKHPSKFSQLHTGVFSVAQMHTQVAQITHMMGTVFCCYITHFFSVSKLFTQVLFQLQTIDTNLEILLFKSKTSKLLLSVAQSLFQVAQKGAISCTPQTYLVPIYCQVLGGWASNKQILHRRSDHQEAICYYVFFSFFIHCLPFELKHYCIIDISSRLCATNQNIWPIYATFSFFTAVCSFVSCVCVWVAQYETKVGWITWNSWSQPTQKLHNMQFHVLCVPGVLCVFLHKFGWTIFGAVAVNMKKDWRSWIQGEEEEEHVTLLPLFKLKIYSSLLLR